MIDKFRYKINEDEAIRNFRKLENNRAEAFRIGIIETMRRIGVIATSKYMTPRRFESDTGTFGGRRSDLLHINTRRLATSLLDGFNLRNQSRLSGIKEGIREIKASGGNIIGVYGTEVPYAAIHEQTGARKTEKSRRFFWAMFYQTNQMMWKAMAITKKRFFIIPPRPYLSPAAEEVEKDMPKIFTERMKVLLKILDK
jgi:phage gpG-like protein